MARPTEPQIISIIAALMSESPAFADMWDDMMEVERRDFREYLADILRLTLDIREEELR